MIAHMVRSAFGIEQATAVAAELGIDFDVVAFDVEELRRGMEIELEHGSRDPATDVTGDDPILTGKIAWAHLKEMPDYYRRLAIMEGARGDPPPGARSTFSRPFASHAPVDVRI